MSKLLIERHLNGDESAMDELLGNEESVVWIDWREEDAAIIQYFADCLKLYKLKVIEDDDLKFIYNGLTIRVPLKDDQGDRDVTIRTVNQALAPNHEIRFVKASDGSDTLAFTAMDKGDWDELDRKFGDLVDEHFERIGPASCFFT